jgi:hypothetical protein
MVRDAAIRSLVVVEEIQKIRAEEITTIRIVFETGEVHEMPVAGLARYAAADPEVKSHLSMLAQCLEFFSKKTTKPSVEFVVPVQR